MKTIFFNQRAMIICREGEQAEKDPEAVFIIDSGDDAILANAVRTIDSDTGIRKLYILCDNPELTYERLRKLFTEVDAAGGLVSNESGQYLLIFRNGMWDLPKGKREKGRQGGHGGMRHPYPGVRRADMRDRAHVPQRRPVRTQTHLLVRDASQQRCVHQASDRRRNHPYSLGAGRKNKRICRADISVYKRSV